MSDVRGQGGFTLTELLIAMSILSVVMMATISAFSAFHKNERQNRLHNESTDMARMAMERMTSQLRNLAGPVDNVPESVEKAEPYDLVFLTVDPVKPAGSLNARNIKRVRYCIGAASNGRAPLIRMEQEWQVQNLPPAFSTASCIDDGAGGWEITAVVANDVVNTTQPPTTPIFTYSPAAAPLDEITAIRANLIVDVRPGERPEAVSLGSGVFLRNQNRKPTAECTAVPTGNGMQVALNASASEDPEGFNLKSYKWYANGNMNQVISSSVVGVWTATAPGTHTLTVKVEDQGGLTEEGTCTATVAP